MSRNLLLFGFSLLIAATMGEGLLRAVWTNPYSGEVPDHLLKLRIQHPNTNHVVDRAAIDANLPPVRFRTGSRSYILPAFQHDDPDVTIAFLGGSTTECSAVREELRFPALVSSIFDKEGIRANTLNAARSAGTLHDSLNVLLNHVVLDRPDIAVLMHATNDLGVFARDGSYRSRMGSPVRPIDLGKWSFQMFSSRSYLAGIVRHSLIGLPQGSGPLGGTQTSTDARVRELAAGPFRSRLRSFVHLARDLGIEPVLMTQPLSKADNPLSPQWADLGSQDILNQAIREVGGAEGVLVIDLAQYLRNEIPGWDRPMEIFYDGMHVTDEGSAVYAAHIAKRLRPLVNRLKFRKSL